MNKKFSFFAHLALAVFCVASLVSCSSGGSGSTTTTTYTATLTAGTGITSFASSLLSAVANATSSTTFVLASGYQNPTATGTCAVSISGTTLTVTFGSSNCSSTISATPVVYYTVTANAGTGTTITPATISVVAGATATFTVALQPGYQNLVATGCTISGTTCTTGVINANAAVTTSATPINAVLSALVTPSAVFDSDYATTPITISIVATGSGFHFKAAPTQTLAGYNVNNQIPFTTSGNGVYTATLTPGVTASALRYYGKTTDFVGFDVVAVDNTTGNDITNLAAYVELGIVSKSLQVNPTQIASGVYTTPNAVSVVQAYASTLNVAGVTQQIYSLYNDVFDTIIVANTRQDSLCAPCHFSTQNNTVSGIGSGGVGGDSTNPPSSLDSYYGSGGFLKGIIQESPTDLIQRFFLHEEGHTYAFYLNNSLLDLTRGNGAHQDVLCTSVGWLGTNQYLVQQPNGDFLITSMSNGAYSDWELYLFGLESASSVPNQYCLFNYSGSYTVGTVVPFTSATLVTMTNIVGVYGARSPSFTTSQKSFRMLFVWLSEQQPTVAEATLHETIAAFYSSNAVGEINTNVFPPLPYAFSAATKGNGTLVTAVPAHK